MNKNLKFKKDPKLKQQLKKLKDDYNKKAKSAKVKWIANVKKR